MTKKQVVEILKELSCEIAQVQICFAKDGKNYHENVLVYLVSEPSNDDQVINSNHWWVFSNINEFDKEIENITSTQIDFIMVSGFISDFTKEIDPVDEQKPAEWCREDEQNFNACLGYIPDEFLRRWLTDIIHKPADKNDAVTAPTNKENTIQWYKVKCSLFKQEFGVRNWNDLMEFMKHTIGFDYTITGQYTKYYTGVEGYYENGQIFKL